MHSHIIRNFTHAVDVYRTQLNRAAHQHLVPTAILAQEVMCGVKPQDRAPPRLFAVAMALAVAGVLLVVLVNVYVTLVGQVT
jgi:hypothetical protein